MKYGYIYILMNKNASTFYIGVTNNVTRRVLEHKSGLGSTFTKKYRLTRLVYFERLPSMEAAIAREKQLKNWKREWKLNLVKTENPCLTDLAEGWFE